MADGVIIVNYIVLSCADFQTQASYWKEVESPILVQYLVWNNFNIFLAFHSSFLSQNFIS